MANSRAIEVEKLNKKETLASWMSDSNAYTIFTFGLLLLIGDAAFIAIHLMQSFGALDNPLYFLGTDRGYPEFYQYMKMFWVMALFTGVWFKTKLIGYLPWVFLFLYLLFDDAMKIHEKLGNTIAKKVEHSSLDFVSQNVAEALVSGAVGSIFTVLLAAPYYFGSATFRKISRQLLLLLMALALVGVVIDAIHGVFRDKWAIDLIFQIVEDGGEMFVVSLFVLYSFALFVNDGRCPGEEETSETE